MSQYLGDISAYALAVSQGYTGTEEEYAELMASYATVGQTAVNAAQTATTKASEAATSATTATNKATEATTAATTATTKAGEASTSASTATSAKDTAVSASQTATTKATEATTAAATAVSAKDDAVSANIAAQSAKTAAQTAQAGAETAAASVEASAAQIATNAEDISQLKSALKQANVVIFPEIQWDSGYVTPSGSSVDSSTAWKKTAPFTLPKGYTLRLEKATGYVGNAISAISSVDNNVYTNRYTGSSGNTEYEYTATADLQIVVSASVNADPIIYYYLNVSNIETKVATNTSNIAINKNAIIDLSCIVGGSIDFSWDNGYVSAGGVNYDNDSSWSKTPPFIMRKGQSIAFTANGYGANLCSMIARKNDDNTYTPLVKSRSGSVETYKYDFAEDMMVVLSCVATSQERTVIVHSKDENSINRIESFPSFSIFEKWGVIGDSFASGVFYDNATSSLKNHLAKSWGQILARESGNTCINFSKGGLWCASWLTDQDRGLPFLLSSEAQELYVVALGINDAGKLTTTQPLGTISDIHDDYTQNPDTFYGNYGKIIGNIKTKAPNAKIIISTIPYTGESAMIINNAIIAIADRYSLPCLYVHTDTFFRSDWFWNNMYDNHPKSFVYARMANAYKNMIGNSFITDTSYWGDMFN